MLNNIISLSDPVLGQEEKTALCDTIDSNWLTMGKRVADFERAFADLHNAREAVAVNSCTAGLHLCLKALDIGPGDEVLVPSMSFVATANTVLYVGANPIFVDIESKSLPHISITDAQSKYTTNTKAVIVMHYGGYLVDLSAWRSFSDRHGIFLIEDAAHAPAVNGVGSLSHAASFSFFSNKNMSTAEGGMVISREASLIQRIRNLRSHGMSKSTLDRHKGHAFSYDVPDIGFNYRMDELRAAMGLIQLQRVPNSNLLRRGFTEFYRYLLGDQVPEIKVLFDANWDTSAHLMPVLLPEGVNRSSVMKYLFENAIQSSIHYPPIHRFTYYRKHFPDIFLPNTDNFFARELTLPLHPGLCETDIERVVSILRNAISET